MPIQQVIHLPCATCGERAASIRVDAKPDDLLTTIVRGVRSLLRLNGVKMPPIPDGAHPLAVLPPNMIAEAVGLTCPACITREVTSDASHANGGT